MKPFLIAACSFILFCNATMSQEKADSTVKPEETTFYDASANTVYTQGLLIKTRSGHYFEITGKIKQRGAVANPAVQVFKDGKKYSLVIQGIEKPIQAFKIKEFYESNIDGDFKGWSGTNSFNLINNQIWQQDDNKNLFANLYRPAVVICRVSDGTYIMKVAGVDESILVVRKK